MLDKESCDPIALFPLSVHREGAQWEAPAPGVYESDDIFAIDKAQVRGVLSEEVLRLGIPYADGKYCYFIFTGRQGDGYYAAQYELQLYLYRHSQPRNITFLDEAEESSLYGAELCPDYFGEWTPQHMTPWGRVARYIKADTGIWFVQAGGTWALSLCNVLYHALPNDMMKTAKGNLGDYPSFTREDAYWELEDCAPVVHELVWCKDNLGLQNFITSMDDLHCCLWECFPDYVRKHNAYLDSLGQAWSSCRAAGDPLRSELEWITKKDGASIHFLNLPISHRVPQPVGKQQGALIG